MYIIWVQPLIQFDGASSPCHVFLACFRSQFLRTRSEPQKILLRNLICPVCWWLFFSVFTTQASPYLAKLECHSRKTDLEFFAHGMNVYEWGFWVLQEMTELMDQKKQPFLQEGLCNEEPPMHPVIGSTELFHWFVRACPSRDNLRPRRIRGSCARRHNLPKASDVTTFFAPILHTWYWNGICYINTQYFYTNCFCQILIYSYKNGWRNGKPLNPRLKSPPMAGFHPESTNAGIPDLDDLELKLKSCSTGCGWTIWSVMYITCSKNLMFIIYKYI